MFGLRKKILVLENDVGAAKAILDAAAAIGLGGQRLPDPDSLNEVLMEGEPTILALDPNLPKRNGIGLLRELARLRFQSQVLVITERDQAEAPASAERVGQSLGLNVVGSIRKPVDPEAVRALMRSALKQQQEIGHAEIRIGIAEGQFFLEYQPKVTIQSGASKVVGAEALARWHHPTLGLLPPAVFMPRIELFHLIKPFTVSVLRAAAAQRRTWSEAGYDVSIAVNVATSLLNDLSIPTKFAEAVSEEQSQPSQVTLELTETGLTPNVAKTLAVMTRLRSKGFALSLDDFGTGHSSLVQLYRMPFTELKVDRSFVSEMNASKEAFTIVRSIIDLGRNLGLQVCAVGVEDKETHEKLVTLGCDLAQGYFYGKPMTAQMLPRTWPK